MAANLTILTVGLPWVGALAVWLAGNRRPALQHLAAISTSLASGIAALGLLIFSPGGRALAIGMGEGFGDLRFAPDALGALLAAIASIIGCLTIIYSTDYMHGELQLGRYYMVVLVFIGAMGGLVLADSLLLLFIFWEITALCSYALISFDNDNRQAVAGGIQALIMTQIGGIGLLATVLLTYASLRTMSISDLLVGASAIPPTILATMAFGVLIAAAAKSAQVPFHTWLPGAMEAPTPVSALIHAATMVNAGVYLLARLYPAFADVPGWKTSVMVVGVVSALLGGLMAAVSRDLKRALAYSTISQLGIMVYAIGVGAIFAGQFHLLNHAVFKALLFLGAGVVIHAAGTRDIYQLAGVGRKMPFVRAAFLIGALALAGLPITNGFWSKELVLDAGLTHGPTWAYAAIQISVAITALYTLRLVIRVFFTKADWVWPLEGTPTGMQLPLAILALGTLTTWLIAAPLSCGLAVCMPYHQLQSITMQEMFDVALSPATLITMVAITLGGMLFLTRRIVRAAARPVRLITSWASADLGFERATRKIAGIASQTALIVTKAETGQINWNVVGIAGALAAILGYLAWSAF